MTTLKSLHGVELNNILFKMMIKHNDIRIRRFPNRLTVKCHYEDRDIMKHTVWEYSGFIKSKIDNFGRIKNSKFFRTSEIEIQTLVPEIIKMK